MNLKILCCLSIFLLNSALARIEKYSDEDVLSQVSSKLSVIETHLKNQRVFVSNAVFTWSELDQFQKDLMFSVAHDPHGSTATDIPHELQPSYLTLKLKDSWTKLEASVLEIESLLKTEEWIGLKADVEQFFKLRDEFLFQPARMMIKNGQINRKLSDLREKGRHFQHENLSNKQLHVRVIDPVIEGLSKEMQTLNHSLRQMKEFRQPPPVEVKTVYKKENILELAIFGVTALVFGFMFCYSYMMIKRAFRNKHVVEVNDPIESGFDYNEWLKAFEFHLKNFKSTEDKMIEDHLILKQVGDELREARKKLNQADSQQDFYASLDELNLASPKIEEYFSKMNLKKNTEVSRKMVSTIVQLCEAIEAGQSIDVNADPKRIRHIKLNSFSRAA